MTTMQIPLSKGYEATIDIADWDKVRKYKWHVSISKNKNSIKHYASANVKVDGVWKQMYMHRYLLDVQKGIVCDHKDGNGLNNTRANIRLATVAQNNQNHSRKRGKLGYMGVYVRKDSGNFRVHISVKGKRKNYGTYPTAWEAALARDNLVKQLHGDFAVLNFPGVYVDPQ